MPRQPEGKLKKRIKAYLESRGALVYAIHGGGDPYQEGGIPDLLVCWQGHFLGLEIKDTRGEKPSKLQEFQLRRIKRAGGISSVVYSVEDVIDLLAKHSGKE